MTILSWPLLLSSQMQRLWDDSYKDAINKKISRYPEQYKIFIISESESALFAKCAQAQKEFVVVFKKLLVHTHIHTYMRTETFKEA